MPSSRSLSRILYFFGALFLSVLAGCGGGGSSNTASSSIAGLPPSLANDKDSNVALINVERGPRSNVNMPYVTVTVCIPGYTDSNHCKPIDHVLLDTGSTGLRIFSSMLGTLALPPHTIGASSAVSECADFLNSSAWGALKKADLFIGNKKEPAPNAAIQIMDTNVPLNVCDSAPLMAPPDDNTAGRSPLSANGILGVGLFAYDQQKYFDCTNGITHCSRIYPSANQQVRNPVTLFSSDNNGVVVQLPALAPAGNFAAQGYLIFGIGTQTNNGLGSANVVAANGGHFTTSYKGHDLTKSFIDSGSNGLFFYDYETSFPGKCKTQDPGFYCPSSTTPLSASIGSVTVNFSIANADTLLAGSNYAFNNLGGTLNQEYFDWGLPFFFGRTVYTVVEGKTVGAYTGPFYAFTN